MALSRARAVRLGVLLTLLLGALALLPYRSRIQAWIYGVSRGPQRLVGRPAPPLPGFMRTLAGGQIALSDLRGRVVLLHFWTFA
jgi:hypothetical protein